MTRLEERKFAFEAIAGVFAQSLPETDAATFDYTKDDMGLIVRGDDVERPWDYLMKQVDHLQATAAPGISYKLLISARHGQGFHNVAETKYGTKVWDEEGSKHEEWSDARLTQVGEQQARDAGLFLGEQLKKGLPAPQSYIVSPLHRCLQTAYLTWSNVDLPVDRPFKPYVKEMLREVIGVHTCDRRSPFSVTQQAFPEAVFEDGFAEEDPLWTADHRETHDEHDVRMQAFLDDVFETDQSTVISLTSHSGSIACLLRVLGHRPFRLTTGAIIPLLVKATQLSS